jgi:hypothetical protein
MKQLVKHDKLAERIMKILDKAEASESVYIYTNGYRWSYTGKTGWTKEEGLGSNHCEFAYEDKTLVMTFEGYLYDMVNYYETYGSSETMAKLVKAFTAAGYTYELGDSWNLCLYPIQ